MSINYFQTSVFRDSHDTLFSQTSRERSALREINEASGKKTSDQGTTSSEGPNPFTSLPQLRYYDKLSSLSYQRYAHYKKGNDIEALAKFLEYQPAFRGNLLAHLLEDKSFPDQAKWISALASKFNLYQMAKDANLSEALISLIPTKEEAPEHTPEIPRRYQF